MYTVLLRLQWLQVLVSDTYNTVKVGAYSSHTTGLVAYNSHTRKRPYVQMQYYQLHHCTAYTIDSTALVAFD
jgi:hypothetical protein